MRPSIAVAVAVRDGGHLLAGALDSVIAQLTPRDRVVVVVGPSSDGTAQIAHDRRGRDVPVDVIDQSGSGLAQARNQAIDVIDHDLVAFCDADDRWTPMSLGHRLAALDADDGARGVIGRVRTISLGGIDVPTHRRPGMGASTPGYTPGALLCRRDVFDEVGGFDERLSIACDSDWFLRLHEQESRLLLLENVVLEKGVRVGSLSNDLTRYRAELLATARGHTARRARRSSVGGPGG